MGKVEIGGSGSTGLQTWPGSALPRDGKSPSDGKWHRGGGTTFSAGPAASSVLPEQRNGRHTQGQRATRGPKSKGPFEKSE